MKEVLPKLKLKTLKVSPNAISSQESAAGPSPCNLLESATKPDSGQALRRANRSALPGNSSDSLTQDTSHPSSSNSLASAALQSSLGSKLRQQLENRGCAIYKLTWKEKITPSGLPYSQLVASAHRTKESDSSLVQTGWLTPTVTLMEGRSEEAMARRKAQRLATGRTSLSPGNLAEMVQMYSAWPTPTVCDTKGSSPKTMRNDGKDRTFDRLDYSTEQGLKITQPIRFTASGQMLTGSDAVTGSSGQLNPAHSRWLMGFPQEWDDCAVTAMQSYQKSPPNSSPRSWKPLEKRLRVKK